MRILVFSAYFTPEIAASMYLTEDILYGLTKAGHLIEMYVPMPTRGVSLEVRNEYKTKKREELYGGSLVVHRVPLFGEGKSVLARALRYVLMNSLFIWKGIFTQTDAIFVQSTPPTQGMMAGIIKAFKRVPFVYNLQDIFPDSLVNCGITTNGSLIWKIGRWVENFTYNQADKIIVISEDFKKNIIAKGVIEEKIIVVPNWADTSGVYPINRENNILFQRYMLDPNKFYICYSGNIGYTQNMDMLLDAAKDLKKELKDLQFILIGDGGAKEAVEARIKDEEIDNVMLLPFQEYADIAHVFSLGDVGLIISKIGVGNNSVPSKTWGIMAAERPILASFDEDSELSKLINDTGCGITAPAGDLGKLMDAVRKLYNNHATAFTMGKNGRSYLNEYLDKDKCVQAYVNVIVGACKIAQYTNLPVTNKTEF